MKIYDDINSKEYRTMGKEGKYLCCNCGNYTTLGDSISDNGSHLICMRCSHKIAHLLNTNIGEILMMLHNCV